MSAKTIMIQGTGSGVGKSVMVAALCRIFLQDGHKVAPFKSQNMSLNSFVTPEGGEIGRAQAMQAEACGLAPTVDMNPILIKPTSDKEAQVIIRGKALDNMSAKEYQDYKQYAKDTVIDSFNRLRRKYEVIVIEGAGSPAEVNLRDKDIVNMFIAEATNSPVILLGDIDKGGVFAWLWGTIDLLTDKEKKRIKCLLINKFRGDIDILMPGLEFLERKTGKKILGVIPYFRNIKLDEEDTLPSHMLRMKSEAKDIKIEVLYLPHISNFTDFDPLEREDDVDLRYVHVGKNEPISQDVDVLIIPGSKSTISDLMYLKDEGYVDEIRKLAEGRTNIIGVCGGYQMLGKEIRDPSKSESRIEGMEGMGLLDMETIFDSDKITRQVKAIHIESGISFEGYEIHMGRRSKTDNCNPAIFRVLRSIDHEQIFDGARNEDGSIWGTYLHGIFDDKEFRQYLINQWRVKKGLVPQDKSGDTFLKDKEYDKLAELVRKNIDTDLFYSILNGDLQAHCHG